MQQIGFGLLRIPEWILKLVYVNVLWLLFTGAGLFFLGLFPATAAMLTVIREWLKGSTDLAVFPAFWKSCKSSFVKSNFLGWLLAATGGALSVYYQLIQQLEGGMFFGLYSVWLLIIVMYGFTALYALPVYLEERSRSLLNILVQSLSLTIVSPFSNLMVAAGIVILYFLSLQFPGLAVLTGGASFSFLLMFSVLMSFSNIERKQQKFQAQGKIPQQ
ncbi:YesL family protein [Salibacterium aidingense]|uniref:YesL family protein n=1 Tax=Salibacterium aidingense TaxID=384933 RepID=UPI00040AF879|nr:DUF624 domain-containing protein [Salibacterium aidingense]